MPLRSVAQHLSPSTVPQSRPVPGRESEMAKNDAGGYVFQADDWTRLDRFLILGSEGGTFYASEQKITVDNAAVVMRCVRADAKRTIDRVAEISTSGRAPKNDPAILALVLCARDASNDEDRHYAYLQLPKVCWTATHLFAFVGVCRDLGVWGRGTQRAVARWYLEKDAEHKLALQLVKYRNREEWTHRDMLRMVRPTPTDESTSRLFAWVTNKLDPLAKQMFLEDGRLPRIIQGFELALNAQNAAISARLVKDYRLPRECIKPEHQNDPLVQEALLDGIPYNALIRNLGNMSKSGLLVAMSDASRKVVEKLLSAEDITRSKIHPMAILLAMRQYQTGRGFRGHGEWKPVQAVVDALDDAFYASVGNVPTSNKRFLLAIDSSGSMEYSKVGNFNITPREAAVAMALITAKVEPDHLFIAYTTTVRELKISPKQRLEDAVRVVASISTGEGTDCALPTQWSQMQKISFDGIVSYTDGETWAGQQHPYMAATAYRKAINPKTRIVNAAFTANPSRLSDPGDALSMECVGLDAGLAEIIRSFTTGEL